MTRDWIFVPVIVQVLLTLLIYVRLIKVKVREMRAGRVDMDRRGLHEDAWPDSVLVINNNIRNQFELPVLFYVVSIVLWLLHAVHWIAMLAATAFVLSRIVHATIHLSTNYIPNRRRAFTVGWWILLFMAGLTLWELARRAAGYGPI
jgi:hypothetical protein